MTNRDLLHKTALFGLVMVYYLGGYFLINEYTASLAHRYTLALPYESQIPFVPQLIFGYMLIFFVLSFTYAVITDIDFFKKVVQAFLLCITIHFVIFLLFPVEYTLRPLVDPSQGLFHRVVHFYYWLDLPFNAFPSMHISNCFLVVFILHRYRPALSWLIAPIAILVAVSCVLVKQHFIADVVAGLGVAWFCYYWIWLRKPSRVMALIRSRIGMDAETT